MNPIDVDVIAPIPEGWGLCTTCEAFMAQAELGNKPVDRSLDAFPPDWMEEFQKLSDLILDLAQSYQNQIMIRVYDPRSFQGMIKALRHLTFRYPAFIIKDNGKVNGLFPEEIDKILQNAGCQKVVAS